MTETKPGDLYIDNDDRIQPLPVMPHMKFARDREFVGANVYCAVCKTKLVDKDEACPTCFPPAGTGRDSLKEPAARYDAGKTPFAEFATYFDDDFASQIGQAFSYGAKKYGKDNWKKGMSWSRSFNSARRHLWAWWRGEAFDAESGIHHLALLVCSIMFLFVYERDSIGKDDR